MFLNLYLPLIIFRLYQFSWKDSPREHENWKKYKSVPTDRTEFLPLFFIKIYLL